MDEHLLLRSMKVICNKYSPKTKSYVVAVNEMKNISKRKWRKFGVIQNTQPRGHIGSHWLLWYSEKPNVVEYFDSFGKEPSAYKIQLPRGKIVKRNQISFQPDESNLCALYCLYVFKNRLEGRCFDWIMRDFSEQGKMKNEILVLNFFQSLRVCSKRESCKFISF